MNENLANECPRCGHRPLRGWQDLSDEEREVARRISTHLEPTDPGTTALHRWCTRCWYETRSAPVDT